MAIRFLNSQSIDGELTVTGNVGIGIANPSEKLVVIGKTLVSDDGADDFIKQSVNNNISTLAFGNTEGSGGIAKWEYNRSTGNFSGFVGTAAATEFMTIKPSGDVGIGTTNPGHLLDVQATTDPSIRVRSSGTGSSDDALVRIRIGGTTANSTILFGDSASSTSGQIIYSHSADAMRLYTAGAEKMRISSTGNVGIGTTNPIAKLYVDGGALGGTAGNEVALLSLRTTNTNTDTLQFTSERLTTGTNWESAAQRIQRKIDTTLMGYMQFGSYSDDLITFGEGNTERMRIDGDGNVGIGTTSPNSELHIASGNPVLTLQDTNSNDPNAVKIEFTDQIDDVHAEIGLTAGNSGALNIKNNYKAIDFYTGTSGTSTLAMQIDDNGNVGIGITNPTAKLHVNGGLRVATVNEATTYSADKFLVADPENVKYVDAVQLASLIDPYITSGGKFVDGTDTNDAVYTTGNVGIGTTSPDSLLHISQGVNSTATNLIIENTDTTILDTEDLAKIEFKSNDATTGGVGVAASIRTVAESDGTLYGVGFNTKAGAAETEKMRITAYGNVGIGIVTPNDKLEVVGAISAKAGNGFKLGNSNETAIGKWYSASGVNYLEGDSTRSFQIGSTTNGVNVRFDNANNRVGIGTTTPYTELEVKGDITVKNANGTNPTDAGSLYFAESGTAWGTSIYGFRINLQGVNNTLNFQSASTTTIKDIITLTRDTAYVGIGTTSPSSTLSVNGVYTGEYPKDSGLSNVVMGSNNLGSITSGVDNFISGNGNLTLATSINRSTVSGYQNAPSVSTSNYNSLFGYRNMYSNTGSSAYNTMLGYENLYNTIGTTTDNIAIGRNNGYTATAATSNAVLLGRENAYLSSSVGSSTMIGWRNCYSNTNAVNQNTVIGYGNMYSVDNAITYNTVMGYHNAYNATDVDYCNLFGYQNAYNAGNLDYTSLFGRENGYSASGITYSVMVGLYNARNATSSITDSALFGRQNAENGFDIQYSTLSGFSNGKAAQYIRNSSVLGRENVINASSVQNSFLSGYRNGYTTTNAVDYSILVGYQNGSSAGSLNNTILLGYRQGYSTGSQGAAAYRLAIGMYEDNPLIYGEFDNEVVKINGSLTVTDRTGGAATKSAFFDSTGQLIEGDPASTISFAISDETSNLTVGSGKLVFRMPYAMTITDVRASVTTPPTGSTIIVDIDQGGSSIFTTNKLSIDAGEKTSTTAATPPNITTTSLNDDVEIIVNIDQVGSTVAGTGLKVYLIGTRA